MIQYEAFNPAILNVLPAELSVTVIFDISSLIEANGVNFLKTISACISSLIIVILFSIQILASS